MHILRLDADFFVPFLLFSIPIVAIVGGITAGIVRTLGQQRLLEMAQRERMAAIERGIDPAKLPPMPIGGLGHDHDLASIYLNPHDYARRRSMNLMVGGVITLFVGIGVGAFLYLVDRPDNSWSVGLVPLAVGLGLLLSSWLVKPKDAEPPRTP